MFWTKRKFNQNDQKIMFYSVQYKFGAVGYYCFRKVEKNTFAFFSYKGFIAAKISTCDWS